MCLSVECFCSTVFWICSVFSFTHFFAQKLPFIEFSPALIFPNIFIFVFFQQASLSPPPPPPPPSRPWSPPSTQSSPPTPTTTDTTSRRSGGLLTPPAHIRMSFYTNHFIRNRHLYVLAVEPRLLSPVDADSRSGIVLVCGDVVLVVVVVTTLFRCKNL